MSPMSWIRWPTCSRSTSSNSDGNLDVSSPGFTTTQPDMILRYNGTTGAFVDTLASGSPLNFPQYLAFAPTVAAAVPGPGALALLAVGLGGLALVWMGETDERGIGASLQT